MDNLNLANIDQEQAQRIALFGGAAVGVGIIGYFTYQYLTKNSNPTFPATPLPPGGIYDQGRVVAMASVLHEEFARYQFQVVPINSYRPRCVALNQYYQLNDWDFVQVANYYQANFGVTLRQHIKGVGFGSCVSLLQTDWERLVLDRMTSLNIP